MNSPLLAALRNPTNPDAPALEIDGVAMTWRGLSETALAVTASLDRRDVAAINATATAETVTAVIGCILRGIPAVPVPADVGGSEVAHILTDSAATCWFGEPRDGVTVPIIDSSTNYDTAATSGSTTPEIVDHSDAALILYTSGTTGAPKGVQMSQGAIVTGLEALAAAWEWTAADTLAHGLPLFHTHGLVLGVLGPLHIGSRLIHVGRPTPEAYAAANASMYFGVPTIWSRIVRDPQSARLLSRARILVSGSAALPVPVFDQLRQLTGHEPIERYGMTETMITLSTRANGERRPGWVGLPVREVETRLRDEFGEPVPCDGESVGQLQVRGPMLFTGYLNLPDVTAEAYTDDGWFITGDLASIDPDNFHRIVGRESVDLIKSGGYRIGAGEIESSLLSAADVAQVAVVGEADEDLGQRIVAYVVTESNNDDTATADRLIAHVAEDLAWHKRPRDIRFVQTLPRNAMGKVQKKKLVSPPDNPHT